MMGIITEADIENFAINDYNAIIDEWSTSWQA
jgi:hypothetical protein